MAKSEVYYVSPRIVFAKLIAIGVKSIYNDFLSMYEI